MDFNSSDGDKIFYKDFLQGIQSTHNWINDEDHTKLNLHYADENHPFLSNGAMYYELQAKSGTDGNWYSVLNLVGANGATITLDGLFANGNLDPIQVL